VYIQQVLYGVSLPPTGLAVTQASARHHISGNIIIIIIIIIRNQQSVITHHNTTTIMIGLHALSVACTIRHVGKQNR
jgi:hypothetical protein